METETKIRGSGNENGTTFSGGTDAEAEVFLSN
jgi:hypothetical protein